MRRTFPILAPAVVILISLLAPACEKRTHREARRAFQEILARDLPPAGQAAAFEELVRLYPEPKTNPNLVRACGFLADYHARAGRADIAASWYERAVRASPDDPDLLNALGYHYARNRMNLDRAVDLLERASRLAEERGYAPRRQGFLKDSLGWAYRMRGDLPLAVALLEEAARLAPDVGVIKEHLAEVYRAIGERDKAAALYLDLYLKGRATSVALGDALRAIGREEGPAYARSLERRIETGIEDLVANDRRETEAAGARQVRFAAADGGRLFGSLYSPREGRRTEARHAGVLLLHPLGSTRAACAATARSLADHGWSALAIDLRGHGLSASETLPDARAFRARLAENLRAAEQDARLALRLLERQPGVDRRKIAVIGAGLGAFLAARIAHGNGAIDPLTRPLVLLSPWGSPDGYREPLSRLPADSVLLIAGAEEEAALATVRDLADPKTSGTPRSLIVQGPGAQFDLAAGDRAGLPALTAFLEAQFGSPRLAGH